jgi:hypothetical protein
MTDLERKQNPWIAKSAGMKANLPNLIVLAMMAWGFFKFYNYVGSWASRMFTGPKHSA